MEQTDIEFIGVMRKFANHILSAAESNPAAFPVMAVKALKVIKNDSDLSCEVFQLIHDSEYLSGELAALMVNVLNEVLTVVQTDHDILQRVIGLIKENE